jgi:ABC-type branched-subunit amino acid transport system substrate-binding protein
MDFSMYINKFFYYLFGLIILSGCGSQTFESDADWLDGYNTYAVGTPSKLKYGYLSDGYGNIAETSYSMAVLVPLSGQAESVGDAIRTSVETAVLKNAPQNLSVSFYDSNSGDLKETMKTVLSTNPDIIIGPVFAEDTKIVRKNKPSDLPVLSFTSDVTAIGNGVMTVGLVPTNGVEEIVKEIKIDNNKNFIIMAPDTSSGRLLAGTAKNAASIYDIPLIGIFYYDEQDTDSIKNIAKDAAMHSARSAAHTEARKILSDILTNEMLTPIEESNLNAQLEKLSKTDTVGTVPYDAILFLGNGNDSKALASFLRYYNVGARDARFYGTSMWESPDITSDFTMSGSKFVGLPSTNSEFANTYSQITGRAPNRFATFGYDAANLAIGMMYSDKTNAAYLLDPSGYIGVDGLIRLKPSGDNERGLRIMQLNGTGIPNEVKSAAKDFKTPLYHIEQRHIKPASAMPMSTEEVNPNDYINIPERFTGKYTSDAIAADENFDSAPVATIPVISVPPAVDTTSIKSKDWKPVTIDTVSRTYIDEYEILE